MKRAVIFGVILLSFSFVSIRLNGEDFEDLNMGFFRKSKNPAFYHSGMVVLRLFPKEFVDTGTFEAVAWEIVDRFLLEKSHLDKFPSSPKEWNYEVEKELLNNRQFSEMKPECNFIRFSTHITGQEASNSIKIESMGYQASWRPRVTFKEGFYINIRETKIFPPPQVGVAYLFGTCYFKTVNKFGMKISVIFIIDPKELYFLNTNAKMIRDVVFQAINYVHFSGDYYSYVTDQNLELIKWQLEPLMKRLFPNFKYKAEFFGGFKYPID